MRAMAGLRTIGVVLALSAAASVAGAAEIKMIASRAVQEAYRELLPAYEKSSGDKVTVVWAGTAEIVKRVQDGETADIVIATDYAIDGLIKDGKLVAAGNTVVAKSPAGAAIKTGGKKPDLTSAEGFKKSLLGAKAIVVTDGPSNPIVHQRFEKLGIADAMKAKEVKPAQGEALTDPVAQGKADMVFSQGSELMTTPGITYVGALPPGLEITLTYKSAYHPKSAQPAAAKKLIAFLTAPQAEKTLRATGLEP